jgi:hypothetical protein
MVFLTSPQPAGNGPKSTRNALEGYSFMPKPSEKPRSSVISGEGTGLEPPAGLGVAGTAFWRRVQAEYGISDIGGLALLEEICAAVDRVRSLTEQINADGPAIRSRGSLRSHPCLQAEIQNRAFIARSLERLGISVQEVKPVGPPTKPTGWTGER